VAVTSVIYGKVVELVAVIVVGQATDLICRLAAGSSLDEERGHVFTQTQLISMLQIKSYI